MYYLIFTRSKWGTIIIYLFCRWRNWGRDRLGHCLRHIVSGAARCEHRPFGLWACTLNHYVLPSNLDDQIMKAAV